jgi:hypothetical protein
LIALLDLDQCVLMMTRHSLVYLLRMISYHHLSQTFAQAPFKEDLLFQANHTPF